METYNVFKTSYVYGLFLFTLLCPHTVISNQINANLEAVFLDAVGTPTLSSLLGEKISSDGRLNSTCLNPDNNYSNLGACLKDQCINGAELAQLYGLTLDTPLDGATMTSLAPAVLYVIRQDSSCQNNNSNSTLPHTKPSPSAVWGYSFLCVTLINLCSVTGILFLPCMKSSVYKVILMFMVSLAVGTLLASGVLVLIPEAFELTHIGATAEAGSAEEEATNKYVWTATSIIGGVYLFFIMERIMRMVNASRENTKEKKHRDKIATRGSMTSSFTRRTPHNASLKLKDPANLYLERSESTNCLCLINVLEPRATPERSVTTDNSEGASEGVISDGLGVERGNVEEEDGAVIAMELDGDGEKSHGKLLREKMHQSNGHSHDGHGHSHGVQRQTSYQNGTVAPVAYMVIFGDSLHNFIDGLSIGAAFTDSVLLGISVCVAVFCEELPHELGDFAILLNAGMRVRKALMFNFLSSLMCYAGLVVGILVGENTTAHTWIFGLAGGMFLYISLVDMVPEMNSAAESKDGKRFGMFRTFLLQNLGLLLGYTIILILALYGGEISFE